MTRHKLTVESIEVASFDTLTGSTESRGTARPDPANCICFAPPCICTNGPDCTSA